MVSVSDVCKGVPKYLLDSTVCEIHIADIVNHFTEWELAAPYLGVTETDESDIKQQYPSMPKLQRRKALILWKQKKGSEATYLKLIKVFCDVQRKDVAEKVKDLAVKQSINISSNYILDVFSRYLVDCYTDFPHPSSSQWPFSTFKSYVNLELCRTPLAIKNYESQDQLEPIDLQSLLYAGKPKEKKRNVVLVEGVAGSGKSTLFWYACNQWAQGRLYQEVKVLIHASFSESEFQSACKLADLVPHPDEQMRDEVARAITDIRGQGVCFLLDACDEAPRSLWTSFLGNFIAGKGRHMLPSLSIVLASRSGVVDNYKESLTGKVVIKGFTPETLNVFIDETLKHDSNDKEMLKEQLVMKPELHSLCCYPLNAVILIHLFEYFKDHLPTTQTGLFHPLICNFLVRHMHTRQYKDISGVPEIKDIPDDLPKSLAPSFMKVSQVAFLSLTQNQKIDHNFLKHVDLDPIKDDMMGLLQIRPTLKTMYGNRQQYTFWHLSVQEFLAAVFIRSSSNQKNAIEQIYLSNPLSPVLSFFAGLTNLFDSSVQDILLQVLRKDLNYRSVIREVIHTSNPAFDTRRQLLALSNCLFECQNPKLWMKAIGMVSEDTKASDTTKSSLAAFKEGSKYFSNDIDFPDINFTLPFLHMVLNPTDMLSIGNFARSVSEKLSENSVIYLDLSYCNIGDVEFKALANELCKEVTLSKIMLRINNTIHNRKTTLLIKKLIQGQSSIAGLLMEKCTFVDTDVTFALKCVIEGLHKSACVTLSLTGWQLNSSHIHHLILLLISSNITCLTLSNNDLRQGMALLSKALLYTKELFILEMSLCNIDDDGLMILGKTIAINSNTIHLFHLSLEFNKYTDSALAAFINHIRFSRITLLGARLTTSLQKECLKKANTIRFKRNMPPLQVRPYLQQDSLSMNMHEQIHLTNAMRDNPQLSSRPQHH